MNNREWWLQEMRYQRAKRKAKKHTALAKKHNALAEKHIGLTDTWINIMRDAADEQERICREEAEAE